MIKDGKFVASVISVPMLKELYYATLGGGAYLNGQQICVSDESYSRCYYTLIGRHDKFNVLSTFHKVNPFFKDFGSISYSMGLLARGSIGGLAFYRNYIWDIAPGTLICKEAGAKIYNIANKGIIIANTQTLLDKMVEHSLRGLKKHKA